MLQYTSQAVARKVHKQHHQYDTTTVYVQRCRLIYAHLRLRVSIRSGTTPVLGASNL